MPRGIPPAQQEAKALFLRCAAGEAAAWEEFLERYRPLLRFLAAVELRRAGEAAPDDIEEAVQETVATLLADGGAKLRSYDPAYRPSTWLHLLVLTAVRDARRKRKR